MLCALAAGGWNVLLSTQSLVATAKKPFKSMEFARCTIPPTTIITRALKMPQIIPHSDLRYGTMLKIIDTLSVVFNCFCNKPDVREESKANEIINRNIYNMSEKHNISILPVHMEYEIENLYPKTNMVHTWTTLVVGKDKTYILANINFEGIGKCERLLNHKANGLLPESFEEFLDPIWDKTLLGKNLQFFMLYNGKTYLVNTYGFHNSSNLIIGACLFMRLFDTLPNSITSCKRLSMESVKRKHESVEL